MDVNEITKVASRKRLNVDAENLREKVSRETAKIIKLKVAQDTAYWDLKEKLQQVEGNHERLQQNMVEVQMQHEAISGQYQEELRLRPDTLNKLGSTREICDVLEDYSERLKNTLARCKDDQANLCVAYQTSGRLVREMKKDFESEKEMNNQIIKALNDKVAKTTENQEKMNQYLINAKEKAESDLCDMRNTLNAVQREKENLLISNSMMKSELDAIKREIALRDKTITDMQEATQNSLNERMREVEELKNQIKKKEEEVNQASEVIEGLRGTVANQEAYANSLRQEIDKLRDDAVISEKLAQEAENSRKNLVKTVTELNADKENLASNLSSLTAHHQELKNMYSEIETRAAAEKEQFEKELSKLKNDNKDLNQEAIVKEAQCAAQASQIVDLQASCHKLTVDLESVRTAYEDYIRNSEKTVSELKTLLNQKEKDVNTKAITIGQLMSEVGTAGETTARLQDALKKIREEFELERQAATEREREKESELSKQMTMIMDMRSEKQNLQEKIQIMQSKIGIIHKEFTEHPQPRPPVGDAPELDDNNAVAFAPTPEPHLRDNAKQPQPAGKSPVMKLQKQQRKANDGKLDSMLFNMFSDTSTDDDDSNMIDRHVVKRRFEAMARGEPLPPISINDLKRRKVAKGGPNNNEIISLPQIRKNMNSNEPRKFFKNLRPGNKK